MAVITLPTPVVSADKTIAQIASGSVTSGSSLSLTSLTSYDTLKVRMSSITANNSYNFTATINNTTTGSLYDWIYFGSTTNEADFSEFNRNSNSNGANSITLNTPATLNTDTNNSLQLDLYNCKATGFTTFEWTGISRANFGSTYYSTILGRGIFKSAAAVSSLELKIGGDTFTAGNYVLWGG